MSYVLFQPMDCQANPTEDNSYTEGCFKKAVEFVEDHAHIIGGVGIAVALIMVSKVLTLSKVILSIQSFIIDINKPLHPSSQGENKWKIQYV